MTGIRFFIYPKKDFHNMFGKVLPTFFTFIFYFFLFLKIDIAVSQVVKNDDLKKKTIEKEEKFLEGIKYYHLEKYDKAIEYFKKSMQSDNSDHEVHYLLAKCYFSIKKYEKAINNVNKAIKTDRKQVFYYVLLTNIYEELNDFHSMANTLLQIIKNCDVDKNIYWFKLANVYEALSDFNAATKCIDNIQKSTGEIWKFTAKKIDLLDKNNNRKKGDEYIDQYLKKKPKNFDVLLFKAKRLLRDNKIKEAKITVKKAYKIDKHNEELLKIMRALDKKNDNKQGQNDEKLPLSVFKDRAKKMIEDKQYSKANQYLETLKNKHPNDSEILFLLGKISYFNKDNTLSIKYLERVINDDISNLVAAEYLWRAYLEIKNGKKLIQSTLDILEIYPNQSKIYLYCGEGYLLEKNEEKALEYWKKGLKLGKNTAIGKEIEEKIKRIGR